MNTNYTHKNKRNSLSESPTYKIREALRFFNNASGVYAPSFFYMKIDTYINIFNKDLEIRKGTKDYADLSTFFHEYTHYLQDIATTYGLINIDNIYGRIGCYLRCVLESEQPNVKFPIILDNIPNAETNYYSLNSALGTTDKWSYNSYSTNEIVGNPQLIDEEYGNTTVCSLNLRLKCQTGETEAREFVFGAMAIIESMANLVENHILTSDREDLCIQYDIVEIICQKTSFLSGNKAIMVALCDFSLMTTHPGYYFFYIIGAMRKNNFIPKTANDIYKFSDSLLDSGHIQMFDKRFTSVNERLTSLFPEQNPLFKDVGVFLRQCINKAYAFRKTKPYYWGNLMELEAGDALNSLIDLTQSIGFTLLVDDYNNCYSSDGEQEKLLLLPAYSAIYSVFSTSGNFKCSNLELCEKMENIETDNNCLFSPWKRSEQNADGKVCAFGAIWNAWNLYGKGLLV